jgi:hypothetical protein
MAIFCKKLILCEVSILKAWGMDVCPHVSVLCYLVLVEALHRADPLAKESYQMSLYVDREAH